MDRRIRMLARLFAMCGVLLVTGPGAGQRQTLRTRPSASSTSLVAARAGS